MADQRPDPPATHPAGAEPDAELERLVGLGPRLKQILQDVELTPAGQPAGPQRGRYRVLRLVGEGGMGSVYEAEQDHPRRRVALKVVKPGMDSRQVLARFDVEREALALMDHPHIARVYDAGATDAGRPFFAMELVDGVPVTDYCDTHALSARRRVELFVPICRAVQHAHSKGVIHRDLKPSNILVATVDGRPLPKVIDFGIAKAVYPRPAGQTTLTEPQQFVGTPEYTSPEQAGAGGGVDTRSDVYSLGAVLYEMLTGTTPFAGRRLRELGYEEARRVVREEEPELPSTRLRRSTRPPCAIAGAPPAPAAAAMSREVRGELDWIVMRCLEKDPGRRYDTPNELAADLERHLRDEPVHAGPPTASYRVLKFARRHRAALGVAAATTALLVCGIAGTTAGMLRARAAQARAELEAANARSVSAYLHDLLASAIPDQPGGGPDARVVDLLDRAAAEMSERFRNLPDAEMRARYTLGLAYLRLGRMSQCRENLARAHELVGRTGARETELGLRIESTYIDFVLPDRDDLAAARASVIDCERILGPRHDVTVRAKMVLGRIQESEGYGGAAEQTLRAVCEQWRREPVPGAIPFYQFGLVLRAHGKLHESETAFREALAASGRYPASDTSRHRMLAARDLAEVLYREGRADEAADVLRDTLAELRPRLGHDPQFYGLMARHVAVTRALNRRDEADRRAADLRGTLSSLAASTPEELTTRADAYAEAGLLADADRDLAACVERRPSNYFPRFFRVPLLAFAGRREEYDQQCQEMLRRFRHTSDPAAADATAKVWLLVPRSAEECERLAPLVELAARDDTNWGRHLKGLAEYRAGRYDRAVHWLDRAREKQQDWSDWPGGLATVELLLSMSHHRLGHAGDARAAFARAALLIDRGVPEPGAGPAGHMIDRLICHVILREAREMLPADVIALD